MSKIKEKTTLVLGAGASKPYGFPTGKELNSMISLASKQFVDEEELKLIDLLDEGNPINLINCDTNNPLYFELKKLTNSAYRDGDYIINKFHETFTSATLVSIDEFLIRFNKYELLGKMLICQCIKRCEDKKKLFSSNDWYLELWHLIYSEDEEKLAQNLRMIKIISFNYDRSLEVFLYSKLLTYFSNNHSPKIKTDQFFQKNVTITHPYGLISDFEFQFNKRQRTPYVEYGYYFKKFYDGRIGDFREYADNINVIGSRANEDKQKEVNDIILTSEKIIFLGFGFNDKNMELLDIPTNKKIEGTCYDLKFADKTKIEKTFQEAKLSNVKIDKYFHEHFTF